MEEDKNADKTIAEPCQMCHKSESKYKCPRCLTRTCSLICVNSHKQLNNCTGIPDKITKVSLKSFDLKHLHKDINFLTDVIDTINKNGKKYAYEYGQVKMESRLRQLRGICKSRGGTLKLAPAIFSAAKKNKSMYKKQENMIYWTVGCEFIREQGNLEYVFEETMSEKVKVKEILNKFFDKTKFYSIELNSMLSKYEQKDFMEAKVFLKSIDRDKKKVKYKEVTQDTMLKDVLEGEEISDFPILYVLFKDVNVSKNKTFAKLIN